MINLADIRDSKEKFDNRYMLIEKIGGGGFSEVWLAYDTNAHIDVALKIYTPNGELDEEGKEGFRKEFARLCDLNHSNIIHAIGFGIHGEELPYLAMSVCKNGSAKKLVGNVEESMLWNFIAQVASGLQYLHAHGITHQDIKPDNVLINSDGQFLIIDFGISTKIRNTLRKTSNGSVGGGTSWYMSVESWGTESPNIHARDIWALGASLYEMITGDVPFGQHGGLTQKAQDGKIPLISQDVSGELKQLVYDCLALNAWDRPDADEIVKRVNAHKAGVAVSPPNKQNKKILLGIIGTIFLGICYLAYLHIIRPVPSDIDSAFLTNMKKAVSMTEEVRKKQDQDISSRDDTVLCSAARIYQEAIQQHGVSNSVVEQGKQMWAASQQFIDICYEYLKGKSIEYSEMGAELAAEKFRKRSSLLENYITLPPENANSSDTKPDSKSKFRQNSKKETHTLETQITPSESIHDLANDIQHITKN